MRFLRESGQQNRRSAQHRTSWSPSVKGQAEEEEAAKEELAKEGLAREAGGKPGGCAAWKPKEECFSIIASKAIKSRCKAVRVVEDWECPGMKEAWCGLRNEGQLREE